MNVNSHKALSMPQFTVRIDDFLVHFKSLFTARANHIAQGVGCHNGTAKENNNETFSKGVQKFKRGYGIILWKVIEKNYKLFGRMEHISAVSTQILLVPVYGNKIKNK